MPQLLFAAFSNRTDAVELAREVGQRLESDGLSVATPFLALDETALRACGFSRQKMGYARDLAARLDEGRFDFAGIEKAEDEAALQALLALKGVGRWSAEIYLLFCLGRADIWPAADLGLQIAVGESLKLAARPGERALRELGEAWRPWRSVAACLFWQSYLHTRGRQPRPLPAALCAVPRAWPEKSPAPTALPLTFGATPKLWPRNRESNADLTPGRKGPKAQRERNG